MHVPFDELKKTLDFLESFQQNKEKVISDYWRSIGIDPIPLIMDSKDLEGIAEKASTPVCSAIDHFIDKMLSVNSRIMQQIKQEMKVDELTLRLQPYESCGIYVPYNFVSSLITWAAAALSAKVASIYVYLPIDKQTGHPCSTSVYAARKLGVKILTGPARFGFATMAFGVEDQLPPVAMLCGPAGRSLNLIKQLSALICGAKADFFAGPSDLAVVVMQAKWVDQAIKDLKAQLEHGKDSLGHLIIVDPQTKLPVDLDSRIQVWRVDSFQSAKELLNTLCPESLELLGIKEEEQISDIVNFGVLYSNHSSSLGDYMVIGRGCADPTDARARSSSGISPVSFLRAQAMISQTTIDPTSLAFGITLAAFEKMPNHKIAMIQGAL